MEETKLPFYKRTTPNNTIVVLALIILLVSSVNFGINRITFLSTSESVIGEVVEITRTLGYCGSKHGTLTCSRFKANVDFTTLKGEK